MASSFSFSVGEIGSHLARQLGGRVLDLPVGMSLPSRQSMWPLVRGRAQPRTPGRRRADGPRTRLRNAAASGVAVRPCRSTERATVRKIVFSKHGLVRRGWHPRRGSRRRRSTPGRAARTSRGSRPSAAARPIRASPARREPSGRAVRLRSAYRTTAPERSSSTGTSMTAPKRMNVTAPSRPPVSSRKSVTSPPTSPRKPPNTAPPTKAAMKPLPPIHTASPYASAAPATGIDLQPDRIDQAARALPA